MDYSCIILILLYFSSTQGFLKKICNENDRSLYFDEAPNSFTKDKSTFGMNSNKDYLSISRASNPRQLMEIRVGKNYLDRQSRYVHQNRFDKDLSATFRDRDSILRRRTSVYSKFHHDFDNLRRLYTERLAKDVERSFNSRNDLRNSLQRLQGENRREAENRLDSYRNRRITTNIDRIPRNIRQESTSIRNFNGDRVTIFNRETRRSSERNEIFETLRRAVRNRVFSPDSNSQEMHREKRYMYNSHPVPEEVRKNLDTRSRKRNVRDMVNTLNKTRNRIYILSQVGKEISERNSLLRNFARNYLHIDSELYRRNRKSDNEVKLNRMNYERRISRSTIDNKVRTLNRRFLDPTLNTERRLEEVLQREDSVFYSKVSVRRNFNQKRDLIREQTNLGRSSIVADRRITLEREINRQSRIDIRSNQKDIMARRMAEPKNSRILLSRDSIQAFTTDERRFSTARSGLIRSDNVRREMYFGSKNGIQISNGYKFENDQRSRITPNERSYDRRDNLLDMVRTKTTIRLTRHPSKNIRHEQRRDNVRQAIILRENKGYRINEERQERNYISSTVDIVPPNDSYVNWFKSVDTSSWHNAIKVIVISMYFVQMMTKLDKKRSE